MSERKYIKKKIIFSGLTLILYRSRNELKNSQGNIEAFGENGTLVWIAERPTFDDQYFDMQIDEDDNILVAEGGGGVRYFIDLNNGKIRSSVLIK
jgi:hypothetical protein